MTARVSTFMFVLAGVIVASPACGRTAPSDAFAGDWVMRLDDRPFMVLKLERNGDTYTGTMRRPRTMSSDGFAFSNIGGGPVNAPVVSASREGDTLRLVFADADDPADKTPFMMEKRGADEATLRFVDVPFEPWRFTRHRDVTTPEIATDWNPRRSYAAGPADELPNPEMQKLFDEDQGVRQSPSEFAARSKEIEGQDAVRRTRTRDLLDRGALRAGEDYRNAAFVFQHGSTPEDYLLAHALAMAALAKGDASAAWIATATLDRYLRSIGQSQIFGTQFGLNGSADQGPYNLGLIPDLLRRELRVPPLADQQENYRKFIQADPQREPVVTGSDK